MATAGDKPKRHWILKALGKWIKHVFTAIWRWKLYLIAGIGLISFGIYLLDRYELTHDMSDKFFGLLSSELGFAILIAVVVFWMIEEWSAQHHCKTAIGLLYGVRPTSSFFDKIEEYVLKQRFYRSNVVVCYAFEKQSGEDLLVRQSIRYRVVNVCTKDDISEFPLKWRVDIKPLQTGNTEWDAQLGLHELRINGKEVPVDEIERVDEPETRGQLYELKKPLPLEYLGKADVEAVHYVVKHDHDTGVWSSTIPSTDIELCLTWESPVRDLIFAVSAMHPELSTLVPEQSPRSRTVKLKQPFLKGHGVHFRWFPASDDERGQGQASRSGAGQTDAAV